MKGYIELKVPDTNCKVLALPQKLGSLRGDVYRECLWLSVSWLLAEESAWWADSEMRRWWDVEVARVVKTIGTVGRVCIWR